MKEYKLIFFIEAEDEKDAKRKFDEDYNCDLDSGDHLYEVWIEEKKKSIRWVWDEKEKTRKRVKE